MTPLGRLIAARIAAEGPMRLDAYMALCLGHPEHGYYATRDPLGAGGDFVTAPEVSQMFGELVGAWAAQVWADAGRPDAVRAGRARAGARHADARRAAGGGGDAGLRARRRGCMLVETSPVLRARQAETLAGHGRLGRRRSAALPDGPAIVVANEFFDALPIRQFQRPTRSGASGWSGVEGGRLVVGWGRAAARRRARRALPAGAATARWSRSRRPARRWRRRSARGSPATAGAALIFDYGAEDGSRRHAAGAEGGTRRSIRWPSRARPT